MKSIRVLGDRVRLVSFLNNQQSLEVDAELEMCASLKHQYICELKDVIAGDK